jgi:predicted RNA-binding Zn-ribbon protein involved in translation (DUF1610 family)
MCASYKWLGDKKEEFISEHTVPHETMIHVLWSLLNEADAVIHYNGNRFDTPVLNTEFLLYNLAPTLSTKNIDLFKTIKKRFKFVSNKLDYITKELGLTGKVEHSGMQLWLDCMEGKDEAWKVMEEYNRRDVTLLEDLYSILLPWISNHPNRALYVENLKAPICPNCGSDKIIKKGIETTSTQTYQRYRCKACKTPLRGRFTTVDKEQRQNILIQAK